jgi:hypothetical protein
MTYAQSSQEINISPTYAVPQEAFTDPGIYFGLISTANITPSLWWPCRESLQADTSGWVKQCKVISNTLNDMRRRLGSCYVEQICKGVELFRTSSLTYNPAPFWSIAQSDNLSDTLGFNNCVSIYRTAPWVRVDNMIANLNSSTQYGWRLHQGTKMECYGFQTEYFNVIIGQLPGIAYGEQFGQRPGGQNWNTLKVSDISIFNTVTDFYASEIAQSASTNRTDSVMRNGGRKFQSARDTLLRLCWEPVYNSDPQQATYSEWEAFKMAHLQESNATTVFQTQYCFRPIGGATRWRATKDSFWITASQNLPLNLIIYDDTEKAYPLLLVDFPTIQTHLSIRVTSGYRPDISQGNASLQVLAECENPPSHRSEFDELPN